MSKKARFWIVMAVLLQALWSVPLGVFFAIRWLVLDAEDAGFTCRDWSGRRTTCLAGDTANMVLTFVFLTIGLVTLAVAAYLAARWIRRGRREDQLRAHGTRARAVVTEARPTASSVNGNRVHRLTIQVPDVPGLEFHHRTIARIPAGVALTVAYDPDRMDDPVILDDLGALARSLLRPPTKAASRIHQLSQLEALRAAGTISEEEFGRLKDEVLSED